MVPGSTLIYGSSFMRETETPRFVSRRPREATLIPFPTDDATPPVTKMNLDIVSYPPYRSLDTRRYGSRAPLVGDDHAFRIPSQGRHAGRSRPLSEIWHPRGVPLHYFCRVSKMTTCVSAGTLVRVIVNFGWR